MRIGVPKEINSFVLTVGATANQNGTALYEGVTVLFLAQLAGVDLTIPQQLMVVYLAVLGTKYGSFIPALSEHNSGGTNVGRTLINAGAVDKVGGYIDIGRGEGEPELKVGDDVEVFVDRVENSEGEAMLSRDRARREAAWDKLESEFGEGKRVEGRIFGRVKGGFTVDLDGAVAFLPGSQVDIRPVRDVTPLMEMPQPFQILKMDRRRGNIVVSRRAILEETRAEQRSGLILSLAEGQVIDGVVKNITDYGAFVDLGGIDGLLHVTDISYKRVNHPSEVLGIGDTVKVQIVRINRETQRISLGMKQLESDPWEGAAAKYPVEGTFTGRVTNITEYGAFVELEPGIEGLVHVSEMSWTKKNVHPGKIVSTSQEVEVKVLEVDEEKRRISLGLKQAQANPWADFAEKHPVGTQVEGEVKNATEFGLFIGLDGDVDGMVHMSDIAWGISGEDALALHRKGEEVKAVVLDVDVEKERISLGMKQLERGGVAAGATGSINKGEGRNGDECSHDPVIDVLCERLAPLEGGGRLGRADNGPPGRGDEVDDRRHGRLLRLRAGGAGLGGGARRRARRRRSPGEPQPRRSSSRPRRRSHASHRPCPDSGRGRACGG